MKQMLMKVTKDLLKTMEKKSPVLLASMAVAGILGTGVLAFKSGLKAHDIMEKHKKDIEEGKDKKEVYKETAKKLVPVVAPTIVTGTVSAACVIGGLKISARRFAVLSAAYSVAENRLGDINKKMTEVLGEKKTQEIKDSIIKDKVDAKNIGKDSNTLIVNGNDVRCMDLYSERLFWSTATKIQQVINKLSSMCIAEEYVTLNDLYDLLGLAPTPYGNDYLWRADDVIGNSGKLPITISAQLTEDDVPVLCLDYEFNSNNLRHEWI